MTLVEPERQRHLPSIGLGLLPRGDVPSFAETVRQLDADPVFTHVWVPDERFHHDMAVMMSVAASVSQRLRIGSAVTDPVVRHPALTAAAFATLNELSQGRVILGMGAGAAGLAAMAKKNPRPQLALREAVQLIRDLWAGGAAQVDGQTVTFNGQLDIEMSYPPPEIWIAGRGPKILELAGAVADGVLIGALVSPAGLAYANAKVDAGATRSERPRSGIQRAVWAHVGISHDAVAAQAAVRPMVTVVLHLSPTIVDTVAVGVDPELLAKIVEIPYSMHNPQLRELGNLLPESVLDAFSISGTPPEVGRRLLSLQASGVEHVGILPQLAQGQTIEEFIDLIGVAARSVASPEWPS